MFLKETTKKLYVRIISIDMSEFFTLSVRELLFVINKERRKERGKTTTRTDMTNEVRVLRELTKERVVL